MKKVAAYSPPPKETTATIADVISVNKALAQLLAEETRFMDMMQIDKVGELQDRKLKLTGLLERYTRYLNSHPELVADSSPEEKAELHYIASDFKRVMKKNYDTLLVARAVNRTIVKCVKHEVTKKDSNPTYNAFGATTHLYQTPISVTLNQTI